MIVQIVPLSAAPNGAERDGLEVAGELEHAAALRSCGHGSLRDTHTRASPGCEERAGCRERDAKGECPAQELAPSETSFLQQDPQIVEIVRQPSFPALVRAQ
jgi:hypothetical protein